MITAKIVIPTYIDKKEIKTEGISLVRMLVTPEIAEFWLKTYNLSNRTMSVSHVLSLSSQMKRGQWIEGNGNTISFIANGFLNDGQHRLAAIVKSGLSFMFSIMVGCDINAFKVTDTGKSRGASDSLAIEGYKYSTSLAAIVKFLIAYGVKRKGVKSALNGTHKGSFKVTNTDVLSFVDKNKESLIPTVKLAVNYYGVGDKLFQTAILGGLFFILSKYNYTDADRFIFQLSTGADVTHDSPMYNLRKRIRLAKSKTAVRIPRKETVIFILKTWNAIRKGKSIGYLRLDYASSIPKIV